MRFQVLALLAAIGINLGRSAVVLESRTIGTENSAHSPAANVEKQTAELQKEAEDLYEQGLKLLADKHATNSDLRRGIALLDRSLQLGNHMAALELALILYFGRGNFEPDHYKCAHYLEQCVEPECHFLLGVFHQYALGGKSRSVQHALTYYSLAAQRRNVAASIALGFAYSQGESVVKNCLKSRDYYFPVTRAMAKTLEEQRIRTFPKPMRLTWDKTDKISQSTQDVIDFYNYNSNPQDANSMLFLGQVYYLGIGGIERDLSLARDYFERAMALDSTTAEAYLGQMDFYGEAIDKPNYRSAFHHFRKTAKEKNAVGLNGMGMLYWKGIEVVADSNEAIKYFKQAAEKDNAEASYNLGKVLLELNPTIYEDKIFSAFLAALRGGFVLAGYELAKLNVSKDIACGLAKFLMQSMLEKHPSLMQLEEGIELFQAGNYGAALSRFLYFAAQGYETAQYNAAFCLEAMSRHIKDDTSLRRRALVLWSQAVDQGDTISLVRTGDYFYYGWGVEKASPVAAAAYYHQAIEKKSGQAAFNLAYLHEHGIGVPLDLHMARKYYEQSLTLARADEKPEAWLPTSIALKHLASKQQLATFRQRLRALPAWTITIAALIIFGATALVSLVFHFGVYQRRAGHADGAAAAGVTLNERGVRDGRINEQVPPGEDEPLINQNHDD